MEQYEIKLKIHLVSMDSKKEFAEKIVEPAMESGLASKEYLQRYKIDQKAELVREPSNP